MIKEEIEVPEGVEVSLDNGRLTVKGGKGENSRLFQHPKVDIDVRDGKVLILSDFGRRKPRAVAGTWRSIVRSMITGVSNGWRGELRLVYSHFPVKMKVQDNKLIIENFLGEKNARVVPVPEGMEVEIKKSDVHVTGIDKEKTGQLCARIEQVTKVTGHDRRNFQDGIYITKKPYAVEENGEGKGA